MQYCTKHFIQKWDRKDYLKTRKYLLLCNRFLLFYVSAFALRILLSRAGLMSTKISTFMKEKKYFMAFFFLQKMWLKVYFFKIAQNEGLHTHRKSPKIYFEAIKIIAHQTFLDPNHCEKEYKYFILPPSLQYKEFKICWCNSGTLVTWAKQMAG